jgi:pimeloyl-ACP methyl ester carboxylesterase
MEPIDGLHVAVDGDGPPVVLCGGLGGNWFDWDEVTALLAGSHRVIRIDRPGYGLSEDEPGHPTVRGEAARIRIVLEQLDVGDPVVIVGHSLGGFYAEAFARLYPDLTAGLIWLDASLARSGSRRPPAPRAHRARRIARLIAGTGVARLLGPAVHRAILGPRYPNGMPARTRANAERVFRRAEYLEALLVELAAFDSMADEIIDIRSRSTLRGPRVVVAVQTSPRTWSSARWVAKQSRFAAAMQATFIVLGPAAHHVMIDRAPAVADLIRRLPRTTRGEWHANRHP